MMMGFQIKGAKRKVIGSNIKGTALQEDNNDEDIPKKQYVTSIEDKNVVVLHSEEDKKTALVIPLPPPRNPTLLTGKPNESASSSSSSSTSSSSSCSPLLQPSNINPAANTTSSALDAQAVNEIKMGLTGDNSGTAESKSTLVIESTGNNNGKKAPLLLANVAPELLGLKDDESRFRMDMSLRSDDMDVKSESYKQIPIMEFGAAMLRGMGWDGVLQDTDKVTDIKAREIRLGLGALPKPKESSKNNKNNDKDNKWKQLAADKLKNQVIDVSF